MFGCHLSKGGGGWVMKEILVGSVHGIEMPELPGEVGSFACILQSLEDFL